MAAMGKKFTQLDETERRLMTNMQKEGPPWEKIKKITGRSFDTLAEVLAPPATKAKKKPNPKGQPKKLPPKVMAKVVKTMTNLQKQAGVRKEITASMITAAAGVKVCDKTFQVAYKKQGGSFAKLKEGPILEKGDIKVRYTWSGLRKSRSKEAWVTKPHAVIDNKKFPMYTTEAGRDHAARRCVRGAYQVKGARPQQHLVKPKGGNMRFPARGVTVTAAVINGKIRMWDYVTGNWNGAAAAAMYKGPLIKSLTRAFPKHAKKARATWSVLEDNDPTGYKSRKGMDAKAEVGIVTDDLPRRSPNFNVLDCALRSQVDARMRAQELDFAKGFKETEAEFKQRLRKTAMGLPTSLVKRCVGDMRRRCQEVFDARGGWVQG